MPLFSKSKPISTIIDGSSLLDDQGDPTCGSIYATHSTKKGNNPGRSNSDPAEPEASSKPSKRSMPRRAVTAVWSKMSGKKKATADYKN